jgi:ribonuclease J
MARQGLHLFALGGLDSCGQRNMTIYDCDGDLIAVDCGFGFPDEFTPGADMLVPDVSYLRAYKDKLKAIFITHRHEDHVGALPWVWADIPAPVYCTSFVAAVLRDKLVDLGFDQPAPIHVMQPGKDNAVQVGKFKVEMVHVNHSTPQSTSLAIHSPYGVVVHSGDYRFDDTPVFEELGDEGRLKELGDAGVLAVLGDATYASTYDTIPSESEVRESLRQCIESRSGKRIFFTTFSTQVYRLRYILEIAKNCGRKVVASGMAMQKTLRVAGAEGLIPQALLQGLVPPEQAHKFKPSELFILIAGCQADRRSGLVRLSQGENSFYTLSRNDTVILSSSWIPGNETPIWRMVIGLMKQGAEVLHSKKGDFVHASGHGTVPDMKRYFALTRPQALIPMHGDYPQLVASLDLAKECGIPKAMLVNNGQVVQLYPHIKLTEEVVPHGVVAIEEQRLIEADEQYIYKERRRMAEAGVVFATLPVSKTGQYLAGPLELTTHGVMDEKLWADTMRAIKADMAQFIARLAPKGKIRNLEQLKEAVRQGVRRGFMAEIGRKPTTIVSVIHVAGPQG